MKAISVTTLGCEIILLFLDSQITVGVEKYMRTDSHALVLPDIGYTMNILCSAGSVPPELLRAVQVYLGAVSGLPKGEYDVLLNGKQYSIFLGDDSRNKFGGNVAKCKLLSSNIAINSAVYPLNFSEIRCDNKLFRITECNDLHGFDTARVAPVALRLTTSHEPPFGFIAICPSGGEATLSFFRFGVGVASPTSEALCAAGFYLSGVFGTQSVRLRLGDECATVCVDSGGRASLYCESYSVSRISFP